MIQMGIECCCNGCPEDMVALDRTDVEQAIKDLTEVRQIDAGLEEIDDAIDGVILMLERGLKR